MSEYTIFPISGQNKFGLYLVSRRYEKSGKKIAVRARRPIAIFTEDTIPYFENKYKIKVIIKSHGRKQ